MKQWQFWKANHIDINNKEEAPVKTGLLLYIPYIRHSSLHRNAPIHAPSAFRYS
jgi:hypothetical protein